MNEQEAKIIGSVGAETSDRFPIRPAYGANGREVVACANYVALNFQPKHAIQYYTISVEPADEAVGRKLERIVKLFILLSLGQRSVAQNTEWVVRYHKEHETAPAHNAPSFTVTLTWHRSLEISDLNRYLGSNDPLETYTSKHFMTQALNILLKDRAKNDTNLTTVGPNKIFVLPQSRDNPHPDLGSGLVALKGCYTSARFGTGRLLLNANIVHGAFYRPIKLDELIKAFQLGGRRDLADLEKFLRMLRVTYECSKRTRTISGLASPNDAGQPSSGQRRLGTDANDTTFQWTRPGGASSRISVADFFLQSKKINLASKNLPVVNVGIPSKPIYVPPELCTVVGGQPARVKLDADQTAKMILAAVRRPGPNAKDIARFLLPCTVQGAASKLGDFNTSIGTELLSVKSRLLDAPEVLYSNNQRVQPNQARWNLVQRCHFCVPSKEKWVAAIAVSHQKAENPFNRDDKWGELTTLLSRTTEKHGMRIRLLPLVQRKVTNLLPEVVIIVFPEKAPAQVYNAIKRVGELRMGALTLCLDGKKLDGSRSPPGGSLSPSYITNVVLKLNLKLRGTNHRVKFDAGLTAKLELDKTMFVGIDVTHPPPDAQRKPPKAKQAGPDEKAAKTETTQPVPDSQPNKPKPDEPLGPPSIAAMVANVDSNLGQWPAVLRRQAGSRQEMVSCLKEMLQVCLLNWKKKDPGRPYPKNIVVYRDGVSEGQYSQVMDIEFPQLQAACEGRYGPREMPRFTIIVVGKRHHTRFYPGRSKAEDRDRNGNCRPGTIVDRGITEARTWDFFLQPHTALCGTARPAHYVVLHDEIFRRTFDKQSAANKLELLTLGLCYTYGRTLGGVSLCTPAYYADKACDRARAYVNDFAIPPTPQTTPAQTSLPGNVPASQQQAPAQPAVPANKAGVNLNTRVLDTMFYI
ncbi:ribonuclease H-like domain-containing protein [Xylariomycetidae sp. FL0641]|nr:ribonuclease H-like domain-containing protein [Xylariomycetidae sp. FL0641]